MSHFRETKPGDKWSFWEKCYITIIGGLPDHQSFPRTASWWWSHLSFLECGFLFYSIELHFFLSLQHFRQICQQLYDAFFLRNLVADNRDFKIRDATASKTRWLIMDWDKNAVVCAGKVKLRSPTRSKKTRLRNALYQCNSSAFLSQK